MSSNPNSPIHKTASAFLAAFNSLSPTDHLALRAENCTHIFAPASLGSRPPLSNAEFGAHVARLSEILTAFPVTAKEININEAGRQAVIWATGKPYFKEEVKVVGEEAEWEYTGEYIFILDMDEDGKITRVVEFLDSLATERLRGLMRRAKEIVVKGQ